MDARLQRAWAWLLASQEGDGSWPDFIVSPTTQGREWTTGYVAAQLAALPRCRSGAGRAMLERAWDFLEASRHDGGGWGFWAGSPVDADSTAWCVRALVASGRRCALAEDLRVLDHHRDPHGKGGGTATYHRDFIADFPADSGYYRASPCVTATVALARHEAELAGLAPRSAALDEAAAWLEAERLADGSWRSYWWDGGIYPTAAVLALWRATGVPAIEPELIRRLFAARQAADGSFGASSFDTALAIGALLDLDPEATEDPLVTRAAAWLFERQLDDGSWSAPAIMRVPDPSLAWDPEQPSGILVASHRRSFVTATVLAALARALAPRRSRAAQSSGERPKLELGPWAEEVEGVIARFDARVEAFPPSLRRLLLHSGAWHLRGAGLSHVLPFWLAQTMAGGRLLEQARAISLANRFGQVYCLLRDCVVDGDEEVEPSLLIALDQLFLSFVRGYQRLFAVDSPFWADFERCWSEYLDALATEQLWPPSQRFGEAELRTLGHKFSPVKICVAAMAELAGARELLAPIEEVIESIQLGVQLLDDLEDARADARHDRPTWPLAEVRAASGRAPVAEEVERWLWDHGCAAPILERARACFCQAAEAASGLGLDGLVDWCRALDAAVLTLSRDHLARRPAPTPLMWLDDAEGALVHDPSTLALFAVELDEQLENLADGELAEELREAGVHASLPPLAEPEGAGVHTLLLGASASGRHRCASCSAREPGWVEQAGTEAPARVEQLRATLDEALASRPDPLHVVVLERGPGVDALLAELRARASAVRRELALTLVVSPDAIAGSTDLPAGVRELVEAGAALQVHAEAIRWPAQLRAVEAALEKLRELRPRTLGVRVELRDYEGSAVVAAERLAAAGAELLAVEPRRTRPGVGPGGRPRLDPQASARELQGLVDLFVTRLLAGRPLLMPELVEGLRRILTRERKPLHCAAGAGALALGLDGHAYPCHVFARHPATRLDELPRRSLPLWRRPVDRREPCRSCEVRYLCGGGCRAAHLEHAGTIERPDPDECARIIASFAALLRRVPELDAAARRWLLAVDLDGVVGIEVPTRPAPSAPG